MQAQRAQSLLLLHVTGLILVIVFGEAPRAPPAQKSAPIIVGKAHIPHDVLFQALSTKGSSSAINPEIIADNCRPSLSTPCRY